jgi:hypothetical protein
VNIIYILTDDTTLLWGVKSYDNLLMEAGRNSGDVQAELLFHKHKSFSLSNGWPFPWRVYFNGDNCAMPPPGVYPHDNPLIDIGSKQEVSLFIHT